MEFNIFSEYNFKLNSTPKKNFKYPTQILFYNNPIWNFKLTMVGKFLLCE